MCTRAKYEDTVHAEVRKTYEDTFEIYQIIQGTNRIRIADLEAEELNKPVLSSLVISNAKGELLFDAFSCKYSSQYSQSICTIGENAVIGSLIGQTL